MGKLLDDIWFKMKDSTKSGFERMFNYKIIKHDAPKMKRKIDPYGNIVFKGKDT